MKARVFSVAAASVVAITGLLTGAAPAMATPTEPMALHCTRGYFCAYIHANFDGLLLESNAGRGSRVQVAGGTSSGANHTGNLWVGVNDLCCGVPDDNIFSWAPYTQANLGRADNDKINYFNVK
jgi:hypothetical protein